jgi:hypothetical protein
MWLVFRTVSGHSALRAVREDTFLVTQLKAACVTGPGVDSASNRNEYQEYFLGCKGGRCVGLTTLTPSCTDCLKIWEPQPPGTLRAFQGLCWDCFPFFLVFNANLCGNLLLLKSNFYCNLNLIWITALTWNKMPAALYFVLKYFFLHF